MPQTITADPRVVATQAVQLVLDVVRNAVSFIQYLPYTGGRLALCQVFRVWGLPPSGCRAPASAALMLQACRRMRAAGMGGRLLQPRQRMRATGNNRSRVQSLPLVASW